jgi:hypothetical protein
LATVGVRAIVGEACTPVSLLAGGNADVFMPERHTSPACTNVDLLRALRPCPL